MKKNLNPILQALGSIWLLFVTYKYFEYHPEYFGTEGLTSAFKQTSHIWQFLLLFGVSYVIWVIYKAAFADRNKIHFTNLTPIKVLGLFSLFLLIFADFWFLMGGFSKTASFGAAQISLISKIGSVYLTLFSISLVAFSAGQKILKTFKFSFQSKLSDSLISIGLGIGVIMLINFSFGLFGQINALYLGSAALAIIALTYKESLTFLKRFFIEPFEFEARFFSFQMLFLFALTFILTLNFIDLIRPMPIGWDDMGVYLNYPKLIAGNQALLPGITNNYFLLANIPFVFIKNEYLAAMNGMFISFYGGFLMLLSLMAFVTRFFKKQYALMAAALIYIIPMTMHQSYADMKTDMTLFFFMILSVYLFFKWFTKKEISNRYLILSGIFAGIAFGIKPTAIFLVFGILIGIFYRLWSWKGAIGIYLIEWIILRYSGSLTLIKTFTPEIVTGTVILFAILATISIILAIKKHQNAQKLLISVGTFILATGLTFGPLAAKNLHEKGYAISINSILSGANTDKPKIDLKAIGVDTKQCSGTARTEELDRYLGYDKGIGRYLSLPWKMTMNTTVHGFYLDLSFLFLSFAPFGLILIWIRRKEKDEDNNISNWIPLILMGSASWIMWLFVGNGVIWYGIFGFILMIPLTAYFFYENNTPALKITTGAMVILSIFSVIALRGTKFANPTTIRYAYGIYSGIETVDKIVPDYRHIVCKVTGQNWNEKYKECKPTGKEELSPVYRIGTFIPYFIPHSTERLFDDAQLDTFNCIDNAFGNNDLTTMRKIKEQGYKYIILDLNTATIEKDSKGSLHQKANRFVEWINNLSKDMKIYVHVYNSQKGIAFMEITDDNPIEPNKE